MADEPPVDDTDKLREVKEHYEQLTDEVRKRLKAINDKLEVLSSGEMDAVPDPKAPDQTKER